MSVRLTAPAPASGAPRGSSGVQLSRTTSATPVALRGTPTLLTSPFPDSHQARCRTFAPPVPPSRQPLSNSAAHVTCRPGHLPDPRSPQRHPAPPGTPSPGSLLASGPGPAHSVMRGPSMSLIV
ncbi:hypothetical protein NDU88_005299 [Pleurodeles waltl]|uniref:Uncharacterized protein n=1 Tax=Pleurodeles waltl TaxID=8319 RepID=A0AAV7TA34_PLEWA|nr:hypothetical protein NDU88_005299 [Pleurodeles waltl]